MTRKKIDFRSPREARKYIYKIIEKLERNEIQATTANACKSLVDVWLRCYNAQQAEELERRIAEIEKAIQSGKV